MGLFGGDSQEAKWYEEVNGTEVVTEEHKSNWTHELLGGAAAFAAARAYENHKAANGQPDSHALAKEIIAGIAGAEVDKLVETKGLDFVDRQRAKHEAIKRAEEKVAEDYA